MSAARPRGVFVTGTDTGVGKTVVAAGIVVLLREAGVDAAGFKPVETGVPAPPGVPADGALLRAASGSDAPLADHVPQTYAEPLAPLVAAERAGRLVDRAAILAAAARLRSRHEYLVAEGAGGLAVPVGPGAEDMADLALALGLPLLVVARPDLGTLNHTTLTVRYARSRGLDVLGIVVNRWPGEAGDLAVRTNPAMLARWTGVPVLAKVPAASAPPATPAEAAALVRAGGPDLIAALLAARVKGGGR